ncbi:MAG: energy-coupling factor ABC transporter ATP-binding protein [Acidimicrobiia bacterium]
MTDAVIEVSGLRFTYPDGRKALRGVDLRIERGQCVALLGPNGAGKTTLALHLNGIHRPDAGTVHIGGLAVDEPNLGEIRRRVALVFQDSDDQLFMPTVWEDVAFGPANLGLSGTGLEGRVQEGLAAVEATAIAGRPPHHLSAGEQRRAALATVLAMRPDVLVLDEPSSGLDPAGRRELVSTLQALAITQLVITHDLPFALELCERAVIMSDGRVVADGRTPELLSDTELLRSHRLEMPFGYQLSTDGPR